MKATLLAILALVSTAGLGQWTAHNSAPDHSIDQFSFVDDNIGYAYMYESFGFSSGLKKTADGGNTWTDINLPVSFIEFLDVHFYADGEGIIVIRDLSNTTTPTMIFQTIDDGQNWQNISPVSTVAGIGISKGQFINQSIGFLGVDQVLYTTTDGGLNWDSLPLNASLTSLNFIDANTGVIGLFDGTFAYTGAMYCTTDGGITWNGVDLTEWQTTIGWVKQIDNTIAYAAPVGLGCFWKK